MKARKGLVLMLVAAVAGLAFVGVLIGHAHGLSAGHDDLGASKS